MVRSTALGKTACVSGLTLNSRCRWGRSDNRLGLTSTVVSGLTAACRATSFMPQKLAREKKIVRSSALYVGRRMPTTVRGYSAISSPS